MYNDIGISNLCKIPDDYIDLIIMTKFKVYSAPKNQGRKPPILVRKSKYFVKIIVKINSKILRSNGFGYFCNSKCVVCKILLSFLLHRTHHA